MLSKYMYHYTYLCSCQVLRPPDTYLIICKYFYNYIVVLVDYAIMIQEEYNYEMSYY